LILWCRGAELNRRHTDFQSVALPTELPRHIEQSGVFYITGVTKNPLKIFVPAVRQALHPFRIQRSRQSLGRQRSGYCNSNGKTAPRRQISSILRRIFSETNREIELVDLMTGTGPILKQALSTGIIIQNRNKNLYARHISRMLFNQSDMMPLYYRILGGRRKRFLNG
jgi:hypothetical protein